MILDINKNIKDFSYSENQLLFKFLFKYSKKLGIAISIIPIFSNKIEISIFDKNIQGGRIFKISTIKDLINILSERYSRKLNSNIFKEINS